MRHATTPIPVPTAFPRKSQPLHSRVRILSPPIHSSTHQFSLPPSSLSPSSTRVWTRCAQKPNKRGKGSAAGTPVPCCHSCSPECGVRSPHRDLVAARLPTTQQEAEAVRVSCQPRHHSQEGGWVFPKRGSPEPCPARGDGSDASCRHCGQEGEEGDARGCGRCPISATSRAADVPAGQTRGGDRGTGTTRSPWGDRLGLEAAAVVPESRRPSECQM